MTDRFWSLVDRSGECWLWRGFTRDGYGRFWCDGKAHNAHRVAWELTHGRIPRGLMVLHRCDVRACVNPAHLFLGTHDDNMRDMVAKERSVGGNTATTAARGARVSRAKLTEAQVREIRLWADRCVTHREIGAAFGVEHSTVGAIVRRKTWRHVE